MPIGFHRSLANRLWKGIEGVHMQPALQTQVDAQQAPLRILQGHDEIRGLVFMFEIDARVDYSFSSSQTKR